jgi:hypothetical protein
MSQSILPAHSLTEVYFYLMLRRCGRCGQGQLQARAPRHQFVGERPVCMVAADCSSCGESTEFCFSTARWSSERVGDDAAPEPLPIVNPTDSPSELIDLAQWLVLFRVIAEQAGKMQDKEESRRLGYEAALCLEEALKFYASDNDLPPAAAFFTPMTQQRFREHPERFSRTQLLTWQQRLPSLSRMRQVISQQGKSERPRRRWWRPKR